MWEAITILRDKEALGVASGFQEEFDICHFQDKRQDPEEYGERRGG